MAVLIIRFTIILLISDQWLKINIFCQFSWTKSANLICPTVKAD